MSAFSIRPRTTPLHDVAAIAFSFPQFLGAKTPGGADAELVAGPIRGALLGTDQLAAKARDVARREPVVARSRSRRTAPLLARLANSRRILERAYAQLSAGSARGIDVGPAGDWLLDNFYIVQEQIREVHEGLPRGFYRELPELSGGRLAGYPRVYELAIALISHSEARVDRDNLELFVTAYQSVTPLTIGELWALPAMFRMALVESVRRMTLRTMQRMEEIESADAWAARIQSATDGEAGRSRVLGAFTAAPPRLTAVFISRFLRQLRLTQGAYLPLAEIEQWISERAQDGEAATTQATQHLALTQAMMANSITSLRTLGHLDWRTFVEEQSVLDRELRGDPAACYAGMTFGTRDRYRRVVEGIARRTERSEVEVARSALDLAQTALQAFGPAAAAAHVGYYLIDDGLRALERATGYRARLREGLRRWVRSHPNAALFSGIAAAVTVAWAAVFWLAGDAASGAPIAVLLFTLIPAVHIGLTAVDRLVHAFLPPRTLPSLDLQKESGIPERYRTAVVVPTLFATVSAVQDAFDHLEVQFLANRGTHLHFAVLSDFTDAASEECAADAEIVRVAVEAVRALNQRYAPEHGDAFYLFHRPRRWNAQQNTWMGWERKRGKLAEFNRFLRGGAVSAFSHIAGNVEPLRSVRYVITLDADTVLPPGSAAELIGTMAHPLNHAVYDSARARVVSGYGILQPRVGISLPSAHRSRFAAIHSGDPGVDPYSTAVSDVYQDLFGEGSFTGKGIYDVDVFEQATHGRFPENTLLSHDLIEGSYARAGLVTAISLYDDYPTRYLTFTRRKHRWIRGDWQLLQWLTSRVPGPNGMEPNRLPLLARWKIFDNLRRSTLELGQLLFLFAGWTILPGSPLRWTALGIAAIGAPWILSLFIAAVRVPFDPSWRVYYASVGRDAVTSAQQVGLTLAFLPHQAWISADAVIRTLWRLFVSRRRLLEWQTASSAEHAVASSSRSAWRALGPAGVTAAGAAVLAIAGAPAAPGGLAWELSVAAGSFALLWLASPAIAHALSRPAGHAAHPWTAAERATAARLAELHWQFFDQFVTAETQWLAPDNFQEDPAPVVAMRTSPTNIGLQLLAVVSARDLGFIDTAEMTRRLELTFRSLERLRRFRGHFFNWYDLHDLRVLEPAYISTVDSGNLAGHLLAVRQACIDACEEAAGRDAPERARLLALAARAEAYVTEMDFAFLYDETQELFSIGYQHASHTLDASFYDLLASESRLASFVAVAKNDVPTDHWFRLGRTLTHAGGATALVSWSGSIFEYLMPALVLRSYPLTLLDHSQRGAVRRHIRYGAERGVPWGLSESAYNLRDRHLTYQYRAFGVPDLALKRGLGRELVVAPYATLLALMVDPAPALKNIAALEAINALGPYGFRDAVDYTRPDANAEHAVVGTYMAHHIGMSLVALTNVLTDEVWPRRFHENPLVRAVELLLHERIPHRIVVQPSQPARSDEALPPAEAEAPAVREFADPDSERPHVALLGQQPYTVMLSHSGAGVSRYENRAITRWRADGTADASGQFCYVRDVTHERVWSIAHQPVCAPADEYRALLATDRATFHRSDGDIETRTEIAVMPEDAAEVRCVTVTNHARVAREIELTSYGEIVLGSPDADRAHPAFANLFVETEWHEWCTAITATRRPRSATEAPLWCVHVVDAGSARIGAVTCETDRARFVGRGRTTRAPAALDAAGPLSGTTGAVLDPIFALRTRVALAPGESACVTFTTLVATSRKRMFELADRYHDPHAAQRALDLAWTAQQVELRELGLKPADAALFQELAGYLLYPHPELQATWEERLANTGAQPLLWTAGVSGDRPIVLATIESTAGLPTLRQVYAAHHFWRRRGLSADLVVLYSHPSSYLQELQDRIMEALFAASDMVLDQPGGVFVRNRESLPADTLLMLRSSARLILPCDGQSLQHLHERMPDLSVAQAEDEGDEPQVRIAERPHQDGAFAERRLHAFRHDPSRLLDPAPQRRKGDSPHAVPAPHAADGAPLRFANGFGGVDADGNYEIRVQAAHLPPAPWINVVANPLGGFAVSERGAGFTWADNSYFYRLTPWHNDPVSDPISDVIYLRDAAGGPLWSATPAPLGGDVEYTVRHAPGRTTFACEQHGIASNLKYAMAHDAPVRIATLRLTNTSAAVRRIEITAYAEWTLGVRREDTQHQVRTWFDAELHAVFARNAFDPQFAQHVAFCASSERPTSHTADRRGFLGRNGSVSGPAALVGSQRALDGVSGIGYDPCAALQSTIDLAPGETRELAFILGAAPTDAEARAMVARLREPANAAQAVAPSVAEWETRLAVITVRTPEPAFDALLNRWLQYQTLSCRMWARSALYQSSGAYGFRDQLQDVLAVVHAEPGVARAHILRAAARQFLEGDVQHWWHPHSGRGVRTRFSDDLAWLPYVVDRYVERTGDTSLLDEYVPFLTMRALAEDEHELYDLPDVTEEHGSVYEHCVRALRRACTSGPHGLPLIGSGDWNDGMNRVGIEGRGESVWLAWFLIATLRAFAVHAVRRGEHTVADELRATADDYVTAVETHGWDGAWYRRAFFDDGAPLGSSTSDECRIDSIAQSWSVMSGAARPDRQVQAMAALEKHLVDNDARLLKLLTPPFDKTPHDPGYIKGYLPGVRENGAQYTHAAVWAVIATAQLGQNTRAFELFQLLNPLLHSRTPEEVATYKVEPYVVAADVYTAPGQLGRGGWTWYTGAAGWMYQAGLESILGFKRRGDRLSIEPRVPPEWPEFAIEYRYGTATYAILVQEPGAFGDAAAAEVRVDGVLLAGAEIRLVDDGQRHEVLVRPGGGGGA